MRNVPSSRVMIVSAIVISFDRHMVVDCSCSDMRIKEEVHNDTGLPSTTLYLPRA